MSDQDKKTPATQKPDSDVKKPTTTSTNTADTAKTNNASAPDKKPTADASSAQPTATKDAAKPEPTQPSANTDKSNNKKADNNPATQTKSSEPNAKADAKTDTQPTQPATPTKTTKEKKGGKLAIFLSILALLGVVAMGIYGWFELQKLQSAVADKVKEQKSLIKQHDPSKKFDAFKENIGKRFNTLNNKQNTLKRELSEVKDAVSASVAERTKDQRDWVIAESEYLIHIANYRLRLLRDVRTATEALKSADRRIGELNDPAFFPVREALAKEISSLQEVGSFDSSGVALKLLSVSKLVHKLPPALMAVSASQADIDDDAGINDDIQKPKSLQQGVLADIARWVGLKENNRPFKALPKQQDVFYLDQLLRLELEAARHAVLRFDKTAYNTHIHTATALLKEHYDEKNEQVAFVLNELRELKARNVFPTLPDISESSVLINKVKSRYKPTETVGE